jgi:hypothetical protein
MLREIDQFCGFPDATDGGFGDRFAIANKSNDAAVVVRVHFAIKQPDALDLHGVNDGVDNLFTAAFRKIWDTLNERRHD